MSFPFITVTDLESYVKSYEADIEEVNRAITVANSTVLTFIKTVPAGWLNTDFSPPIYEVPGDVQAAALLIASEFFENRTAGMANLLSQSVVDLLTPYRDPTFQ